MLCGMGCVFKPVVLARLDCGLRLVPTGDCAGWKFHGESLHASAVNLPPAGADTASLDGIASAVEIGGGAICADFGPSICTLEERADSVSRPLFKGDDLRAVG